MRASMKALLGLFAAAVLASCGGGGGGDSNSGFNPPGVKIEVSPASATSTPGSLVPVSVRVTGENGAPVVDGTAVTLSVSPPGVGLVSSAILAPPNAGGTVPLGETATTNTTGGVANFRLHTRNVGTATLTASANVSARTSSGTAQVAVQAGLPNDNRLTIQVQSTRIPIRPRGLDFNDSVFFGSPFISEVVVTWRNIDGTCVVPRNDNDAISIAIGPGLTPSGIWHDDPSTDESEFVDENGNVLIFQSIAVTPQGCRALFYVVSDSTSGPVSLTAVAVDQLTGETITARTQLEIFSGAVALPGSVVINTDGGPVFAQGVNGRRTLPITVFVADGGGTNVPDPAAGVNNVVLEIVGGAPTDGDRLRGVNAAGQNVAGRTISIRTVNGVAGAIYEAGTRTGTITIRATSDRADNNVDNGIQDPVVSTRTITVSDGRLFDIEITFPTLGALLVNPALAPGEEGIEVEVPGGTITIPNRPNGTYTLTVSAIATDRFGNPVPAGTEIRFGLVDHPLVNNFFAISGNDGDPQEGGTLFTAPTGRFTTAGGGAGPGDTLLVFGEESPGNRDLESARTIQTINSPTSLTVTRRFNFNDDTGVSVNNGPVLPYVIGRATVGTIEARGFTDAAGVVTVELTYPVSQIGRLSAVYAQGEGDIVNGTAELVTDVEFVPYPGLAPGQLTADPAQIPGNSTQNVTVCVRDALGNGLRGVTINFAFEGLTGSGSVDGVPNAGVVATPTGTDGCTIARVTTAGVVPPTGGTATPPRVRFSFGNLSDTVEIISGQLVLQAIPSAFSGDGAATVTLRLLDSAGNPVPGVQLTGSCEAEAPGSLAIIQPPGVTNAQGETTARIEASGFNTVDEDPPSGECEFSTPSGTPSATVTWSGFDLCDVGVSPVPTGCPMEDLAEVTLTINATSGVAAVPVSIQSGPPGITCSAGQGATQSCDGGFAAGTNIIFSASVPVTWTGQCAPSGGTNPSTNASMNAVDGAVCNAGR